MSTAPANRTTCGTVDRYAINAIWLMKLRWVAVVGQLTTIVVVTSALRIAVQLPPLLVALAVTTLTNLVFTFWLRRQREVTHHSPSPSGWHRVFLSLMLLDLVVLTLLLYFTGGHANPFSLFYFVNLALSGILVPPSRAWLLTALSVACFAGLFFFQVPLAALQQPNSLQSIRDTGTSTLGHRGLLVAFTACSAVIVYFVTRLNDELRRADAAVSQSQMLQAQSERWEALGTLSAGAAHELATPLTTIAIVTKEIENELKGREVPQVITTDVQTIRREVTRCRAILDRMSIDAGHATAEANALVDANSLIRDTLREMPHADRISVAFKHDAQAKCVEIPTYSVQQALRGVVQNALDASLEQVEIDVGDQGDALRIEVRDHGTGMTREVLEHADEPFFTTKDAGKGMGLGRFLARTVFERIGGTFSTESTVGTGTTVTVTIPKLREAK